MTKATWKDGERTVDLSQVEQYTAEDADDVETILFPQFRGRLEPDVTFLGFDKTPAAATGDPNPNEKDAGWFFVIEEPMGETRFGFDEGEQSDEGGVPMGIKAEAGGDLDGGDRVTDGIGDLQDGGGTDSSGGLEPAWDGLSWWHVAGNPAETPKYVDVWNSRPGGRQDLGDAAPTESKTWRVTDDQVAEWTWEDPDSRTTRTDLIEARPELATMAAQWGHNSAHMARITWQRPVRVLIHADDLLSEEASEGAWTGDDGGSDVGYAGPYLGDDASTTSHSGDAMNDMTIEGETGSTDSKDAGAADPTADVDDEDATGGRR
jgi:hypothetical protein